MGTGHILLGVTLRWTSIPSRRGVAILSVASWYRNRDKLRPGGPSWLVCNFTFTLPSSFEFSEKRGFQIYYSFIIANHLRNWAEDVARENKTNIGWSWGRREGDEPTGVGRPARGRASNSSLVNHRLILNLRCWSAQQCPHLAGSYYGNGYDVGRKLQDLSLFSFILRTKRLFSLAGYRLIGKYSHLPFCIALPFWVRFFWIPATPKRNAYSSICIPHTSHLLRGSYCRTVWPHG